jgi:arylsulfatase A-like enzyme
MTRHTIVVFTSDNGGERFSDTWPFIGQKGELLEGGIRVPLVMRWPGHIRAGSSSGQVMISMDFLPTLLAAAGGAPDPSYPSDGMNLLPVLLGDAPVAERKLYWRFKASEQAAVRAGRMKYVKLGAKEGLFDVVSDPRERANLKDTQPEVFAHLKADFAAWNATMLPYPARTPSPEGFNEVMDRY